jgi:hypothetical protein
MEFTTLMPSKNLPLLQCWNQYSNVDRIMFDTLGMFRMFPWVNAAEKWISKSLQDFHLKHYKKHNRWYLPFWLVYIQICNISSGFNAIVFCIPFFCVGCSLNPLLLVYSQTSLMYCQIDILLYMEVKITQWNRMKVVTLYLTHSAENLQTIL